MSIRVHGSLVVMMLMTGLTGMAGGEQTDDGEWIPEALYDPDEGRNFEGHWMRAPVEPGEWVHVALVLRDAVTVVQDDRMHLYLNGEHVASGPGVRIPRPPVRHRPAGCRGDRQRSPDAVPRWGIESP